MAERLGWQQQAEALGFKFHSIDGTPIGTSPSTTDFPSARSSAT